MFHVHCQLGLTEPLNSDYELDTVNFTFVTFDFDRRNNDEFRHTLRR